MHKYLTRYERVSAANRETFRQILSLNLALLKFLLVFAQLILLSSGLK